MQMIYRLFPLLGHKSHPRSFRIQSCSVLNSIQEGTWEHAVGRSCVGFYRALHMVKPGTCTGPSPPGPAGLALTGQQLWSLRVGSRAPTLCHSRAEDSFPLQSGPWGAMTALSETVTPPKVAPELLSPRLSTEPQRAQPKLFPGASEVVLAEAVLWGENGEKVGCWARGQEERRGWRCRQIQKNVGTFHQKTGISPGNPWVCLERILLFPFLLQGSLAPRYC